MVRIRAAFARYPWTSAVLDRSVSVPGLELDMEHSDSIVQAYRAMARDASYGACEMAPVTYLAARAAGAPLVGLPVFTFRRFHHDAAVCPVESDIASPADLAGRRVGVRAYSVTSAVWARGVWAHEYGLDLDSVTWVTDDDDNVPSITLPPRFERLADGTSLRAEYQAGRIDACFAGVAGLGRQGAPADWGTDAESRARTADLRESRSVIADPESAARDWYGRTGILPAHGMIVVHADLLAEHPEIADDLVALFGMAKDDYLEHQAGRDAADLTPDEIVLRRNAAIVGGDPLPFGLDENAAAIDALIQYSLEQRLVDRADPVDALFATTTEDA